MADRYDVGDRPRVRLTFTDLDGVAGDPVVVSVYATDPTGASIGLTASRVSAGTYDAFVNVTVPGRWKVRGLGTGGLQAAVSVPFVAREP